MFPAIFPNARIWPRYELKCTFRKRNNLFPDSQCFTYESSHALDSITGLVNGCNIEHLYIWSLCRIYDKTIIHLNKRMNRKMTYPIYRCPIIHFTDCRPGWPADWPVPPAIKPTRLTGWANIRTDSKMDVWMNEQMPGYAHNMNWNAHLRNLKIFCLKPRVSLTNDR